MPEIKEYLDRIDQHIKENGGQFTEKALYAAILQEIVYINILVIKNRKEIEDIFNASETLENKWEKWHFESRKSDFINAINDLGNLKSAYLTIATTMEMRK
jgi:hypothetical protein